MIRHVYRIFKALWALPDLVERDAQVRAQRALVEESRRAREARLVETLRYEIKQVGAQISRKRGDFL